MGLGGASGVQQFAAIHSAVRTRAVGALGEVAKPVPLPPGCSGQVAELATTNGPWAQGEGLQLAQSAGGHRAAASAKPHQLCAAHCLAGGASPSPGAETPNPTQRQPHPLRASTACRRIPS